MLAKRPDLTIVVPTYNERDQIDILCERVFRACELQRVAVELVIVDDNSPDGTGDRADEWARRSPVRVIHRAGKLGLGSAVLEGFAIAESDIVGVMDADLSHPPELVPTLLSAITSRNLDMIVASRYIRGGGTRSWSVVRLVLSRVACWLARPLTPVRDAMSGFFLIRRDRLSGLCGPLRGFKIGLELLVRAEPRRIAEVGYVFVGRVAGKSKMSIAEGLRFLRQLAALYTASFATSNARPSHHIVTVTGTGTGTATGTPSRWKTRAGDPVTTEHEQASVLGRIRA
jgi:dolichol-phosphate mannosyltransferase